jgi:hypothetical protein
MLPQVDIVSFLNENFDFNNELKLKLTNLEFKSGNISLFELFCICAIIKVRSPELVMEFGTFNGRTTINIANNLPDDSKIITFDLPFDQNAKKGTLFKVKTKFPLADGKTDPNDELGFVGHEKLFKDHFYYKFGKIKQIWADTGSIDSKSEEWNNKADLFFIDASHTFENCYNDSKTAYEIIKQFGIIIWHDYGGWDGVTKAIDLIYEKINKTNIIYINMYHIKDTSLAVGVVINKGGIDLW